MTSQDQRPEHDTSDAARALRQQAEVVIQESEKRSPDEILSLTPEEIRRTLYELRVHQIELTMQNEELRRAQAEIDAARARYFDLYELAPVGYCTLSETGLILEANLTAASLLETPKSALIKQPLSRFIVKDDQDLYYLHRKRLFETGEPQECDLRTVKPDGAFFWVHLTATAAQAVGGAPVYRVAISDITARKEYEGQLEHLAHFDALTNLPNRELLADRMHQDMAQTHRRGQQMAVAYLDLDGFKAINDRYGHAAGDEILIAVANRMRAALREGDVLARLGGDEFVVVLVDLSDIKDAVPLLNRLLAAATEPVQVDEFSLRVSASIGVTVYPQTHDVDADQLLRQADQAMYHAKLSGKNRYHFFDTEQDQSIRGHHAILERIHRAWVDREFTLYYQPKVNLRTGTTIGVEALIRWQHPELGLLPPRDLLPAIENHPLAVDLGEWVVETALIQMEAWQAIKLDLPVSVNIGARQLQQRDFVARLSALLAAHPGVEPSRLELEILETSVMEDLDSVFRVIEGCRALGVSCALDDFGTGYSSLTYLKRLPVTQIKIDQSFVCGMLDDPEDLAIVESVLSLAVAFRRQVIAEGVETLEHGELLLRLGCDLAQGFGIARPMPACAVPGWLAAWRPPAHWTDLSAMSRDDRPLLFAGAEHRAWVVALEKALQGDDEAPPPLGDQDCRFSQWMRCEQLAGHDREPSFQLLEPLHQRIHALADTLLELQRRGRGSEARARLGELHVLRDALSERLRELARERGLSAASPCQVA